MILVKGIGISSGREMGTVHKLVSIDFKPINKHIDAVSVEDEKKRVLHAFEESITQLEEIVKKNKDDKDMCDIIRAHVEILKDPAMKKKVMGIIEKNRSCAEDAIYEVVEEFATMMEGLDDEYMRERAADIRDVGKRLFRTLLGFSEKPLNVSSVVVADDLTPSILSSIDRKYVKAIVSGTGGKTSHIAIMANGMGIPAIAGLGRKVDQIKDGDTLIVDGKNGIAYVNPDAETTNRYLKAKTIDRKEEQERLKFVDKKAITEDGIRQVQVCANIAFLNECDAAKSAGAEGIGLYRTEFLYMDSNDWPDEETQFQAYKSVLQTMAPNPVVIRTMDIGGDKGLSYMNLEKEDNPFLGYRAIRISLGKPEIFKTQLRALLRASIFGELRIMFPMISSLPELMDAKEYVRECKDELRQEQIDYDDTVKIGIMIEVPAAAVMADTLASEVDFFSIGTNDLTQYTMAADRMNNHVAEIYDYFQPAVLHLINFVIDAAHKHGKTAGMCGEMAGSEKAIRLLVGMGLDEFSMSAGSILRFKSNIAKFNYDEAKEIAQRCLACKTCAEVHEILRRG